MTAPAASLLRTGALPAAARIELSWLRLLSGVLFLGALLPMKNGAFLTDGARTWRLLRGGAYARAVDAGDVAGAAPRLLAAIPASSPWLESYDRLRAEAAIARANVRRSDAADAIERALEIAPPTASFCRARLEEMRESG